MAGYKNVLGMVLVGSTARQIQDELKLPPSRLERILESPCFQRELKLAQQVTQMSLTLRATDHADWAFHKLADMMNSRRDESSRKACMAVLRQAESPPFLSRRDEAQNPEKLGRARQGSAGQDRRNECYVLK